MLPWIGSPLKNLIGGAFYPHGLKDTFPFAVVDAFHSNTSRTLVVLVPDNTELERLENALRLFSLGPIIAFPSWDCLAYDRRAPSPKILRTLEASCTALKNLHDAAILLLTPDSFCRKYPLPSEGQTASLTLTVAQQYDLSKVPELLLKLGYHRGNWVLEPGDFSLRGGFMDLYPFEGDPFRADFFGDTLESLHKLDIMTSCAVGESFEKITIHQDRAHTISSESWAVFWRAYQDAFPEDALALDRHKEGSEKTFPLWHHLSPLSGMPHKTVWDFLNAKNTDMSLVCYGEAFEKTTFFYENVFNLYHQRLEDNKGQELFYPALAPEALYAAPQACLESVGLTAPQLTPHEQTPHQEFARPFTLDPCLHDIQGPTDKYLFYLDSLRKQEKPFVFFVPNEDALKHLQGLLQEHHRPALAPLEFLPESPEKLPKKGGVIMMPTQGKGWSSSYVEMVSYHAFFHQVSTLKSYSKQEKKGLFLDILSALNPGDYVVHRDHGLGHFQDLETVSCAGRNHSFLKILFANEDRLYVPVENMDVLSKFAGEETQVTLDTLGSAAFQKRQAKVKRDLWEAATYLADLAAKRMKLKAPLMTTGGTLVNKVIESFAYVETQDQIQAFEDCCEDLASGTPMDRLLCGDVGFGKTEVALRVAAVALDGGYQVAFVAPTTLLANQHYQTLRKRFQNLDVNIEVLTRFTPLAKARKIKKALQEGEVDLIIATHTLFSKKVVFKNLGFVVIDEEQHFGVKHKERLKSLAPHVHLLSLSATPIPRTLHLSLTGIREMSLLTTPPLNRKPVKTFVTPFDAVTVKEALMREYRRGGQSFVVCPRIKDLESISEKISRWLPMMRLAVAHGQVPKLPEIMEAFSQHDYDILVATNIVESGLDIARVNTLIVVQADRFGLGQLYQLRGRVGRGEVQGYTYLTAPINQILTQRSQERLGILKSFDQLGSGFHVASQDLDMRGAGNLLGKDQSGHIKEVGLELYHSMLQEAMDRVQGASHGLDQRTKKIPKDIQEMADDMVEKAYPSWTPSLNLSVEAAIPESYMPDKNLRLATYRDLSKARTEKDLEEIRTHCLQRFGLLPEVLCHLFSLIRIKQYCYTLDVAKVDAGPRGVVLRFRDQVAYNPESLVAYVTAPSRAVTLKPDGRLVFLRVFKEDSAVCQGVLDILKDLMSLKKEPYKK